MKVRVLLFAGLASRVGRRDLELDDVESGCSLGTLLERLAEQHPVLGDYPYQTAVNGEYSPRDRSLEDGDELALIPPVSGG